MGKGPENPLLSAISGPAMSLGPFANHADYEECRRLHKEFGSTYYFSSRRFPKATRRRVDSVYGFVRVPDEWVDNPGHKSEDEVRRLLTDYRRQLVQGIEGVPPSHPVLRAFCDTMHATNMDLEEPTLFMDAMEQDLDQQRYEVYEDLRHYMRGSAASVGLMMCWVTGAPLYDEPRNGAIALGEAMQLTNFLRDIAEDYRRGRIYIPLEDMDRFGVGEDVIAQGKVTPEFKKLMEFEIERARDLYRQADDAMIYVPKKMRLPVRLARVLYSRILVKIEELNFDVFSQRAHTTKLEKLRVATAMLVKRPNYEKNRKSP